MTTNFLHVANWLAWWGLVSLLAFFLFATFAHIVDLLFFPDPEKPQQSAHLCGNRSGVPLQEGGVANFASKGVMPSAMHLRHAKRLLSRASEIAVSDGVTHPSENTFSKQAIKGFARKQVH